MSRHVRWCKSKDGFRADVVALTGRWGIGTLFAIAGCALLTIPGATTDVDPIGVGLGMVAACCFGTYTVAAKRLTSHGTSMPAAVSVTLLVGGTLLLPWAVTGIPELGEPGSIALVAWLGIAATAAAYMLFVTGLRLVAASTAGTLSLAEPLVAAALALLILGERLSPTETAGALLLFGGLALVSLPRTGNANENRDRLERPKMPIDLR